MLFLTPSPHELVKILEYTYIILNNYICLFIVIFCLLKPIPITQIIE